MTQTPVRILRRPRSWAWIFSLTALAAAVAIALRFMSVPPAAPRATAGGNSVQRVDGGMPRAAGDLHLSEMPADTENSASELELAAGERGPADAEEPTPIIEHSRFEAGSSQRAATQPARTAKRTGTPGDETATNSGGGGSEKLNRTPEERQKRVQKFGGSVQTEGAVESGLAWLAAHQSPDGSWGRDSFLRQCPRDESCGGKATVRTEYDMDAGLSGLATLAFLGAGYTPTSGPYQEALTQAANALLAMQQEHGGFSKTDSLAGYNDSVATLALAECYAMTREPRLKEPLQRAVRRIVNNQQELGGWDYLPNAESGRNDTSITAWVVQALQACVSSGIPVPQRALAGAAMHIARASQSSGKVWYADSGEGFSLDSNRRPSYRYGPAMSACGLVCENLLGWRFDAQLPASQRVRVLTELPSSVLARGKDRTGLHSEYYWYYGTLAMFQAGGEHWERWNARLRDTVLPLQNRDKFGDGRRRHAFGSWAPYGENWGKWGRMGGRVYTTAICVLTLEIYYRHTPAYLDDDIALTANGWRGFLGEADSRQRMRAIPVLRDARHEIGEPVLVELLRDGDAAIALAAAVALAAIDSPIGHSLLDEVVTKLPPWERTAVERALAQTDEIRGLPPAEGSVRLFDEHARLATLDMPRSYAGMTVVIRRGDARIAQMEVIQRISGRNIAIAQLMGGDPGSWPREGDAAVGR